jgi:hypothetical protein
MECSISLPFLMSICGAANSPGFLWLEQSPEWAVRPRRTSGVRYRIDSLTSCLGPDQHCTSDRTRLLVPDWRRPCVSDPRKVCFVAPTGRTAHGRELRFSYAAVSCLWSWQRLTRTSANGRRCEFTLPANSSTSRKLLRAVVNASAISLRTLRAGRVVHCAFSATRHGGKVQGRDA